MPCLILTGHPCVGKTTVAHILKERALQHSSQRIQSVVIVNEEMACPGLTQAQCYLNSHNEKKTRAALKACFDHAVATGTTSGSSSGDGKQPHQQQNQLVILDSLNYIKGFRYELFCISKAAGEQHGVIWVMNSMNVSKEWNRARNNDWQEQQQQQQEQEEASKSDDKTTLQHAPFYSDRTMDELIQRFEPPDERNRWDKPLYKVDVRPPEIKQQHQQQEAAGDTEGEILDKSVYNMHALSHVMGKSKMIATPPPTTTTTTTATTRTTNEESSLPNANSDATATTTTEATRNDGITEGKPPTDTLKKTFKGFKRAAKTAKPIQATILSSSAAVAQSDANAAPLLPTYSISNDTGAVLYPKDFLFSSRPSEQPLDNRTDSVGMVDNRPRNIAGSNDDNHHHQQQHHKDYNEGGSARYKDRPKKSPLEPPKPDPMSTVEEQIDAILDSFLLHVQPLKEGTSTQRPSVAGSANVLHEMDAITQSVCDAIVQGQTQGTMVGRIPIVLASFTNTNTPIATTSTTNSKRRQQQEQSPRLFLETNRRLPLAELKRLRRQYLRWVATNPPDDCDNEYGIAQSFVAYITAQL